MKNSLINITKSGKKFDEAVVSVLKSIDKKGWSVFQIYDIKERLAAKGFNHSPLKIIELCSAKHANALLGKTKFVSLCMPCKIVVIEDKGKVEIASMNPQIMSEFFQEIEKKDTEELERDIKEIITNVK